MTFKDRADAGKLLAFGLRDHLPDDQDAIVVVGLPRGGVVVAKEIARALKLPLDAMVIKKIGHPENPEFAVGAVGEREIFLNPDATVDGAYIRDTAEQLRSQIKRQKTLYRAGQDAPNYENKIVILVDDGIATGLTVKVAIAQVRAHKPKKIILAVPVASADSLAELSHDVDDLVCLYTPAFFMAVGQFYENFEEVSEHQVAELLKN